MNSPRPAYHGYRFPPEIISHAVWLCHRFCLSFRDVEDSWPNKLRSDAAACRAVMPDVTHSTVRYENNRAEVSHQLTRQRERQMRRLKSPAQARRFLSVHVGLKEHGPSPRARRRFAPSAPT